MRALVSDFRADKRTWNMTDEFMFGKALLVAPIVKAQYTPEKTVAVDAMSGWDRKRRSN
jgi:alpha-D-xyloside xylohydrolase